MREDINSEIKAALEKALEAGISDESMAKIKKQVASLAYEIESDLDYAIKNNLANNLVAFVADMAKRTVEAIIDGNEDQMRRYLGCERGAWNGRSDGDTYGRKRDIDEWHPVIHGTLFESGPIATRRDIVAAHRDLITDERVKDLEDQVASLVAQNNKLTADLERARRPF